MVERRRWGRVKVPDEKILCGFAEPKDLSKAADIPVIDISAGGISFFSEQELAEGKEIRFIIKFPSTFYLEEGMVWGKVVHCTKIDKDKRYLVGVFFIRKKK